MFKKLSIIMMAFVFLFSGFSGILITKASAATNEIANPEFLLNQTNEEQLPVKEELIVKEEQPVLTSVPSYLVKKAAKWALDNTTTITNLVGKTLGREAAVSFGKVVNNSVKPKLRALINAQEATYGQLENVFVSALESVVSTSNAKRYAGYIMEVIELLGPL